MIRTNVLEDFLLALSTFNHRVSKLYKTVGSAAVTPERLTEIAADCFLDAVTARLCPGYGDTHVWAWTQAPTPLSTDFVERCEKHPDRRAGKERRK